jgi:hypothetical protein
MPYGQHASRTIEDALRLIDDTLLAAEGRGNAFMEFANLLRRGIEDLGAPMRVAFVGKIKTSKSTLINAILSKEEVLHTGDCETTWNVSWLEHGPNDRQIQVVFKRELNRPDARVSREEWGEMANRAATGELKNSVHYFKVSYAAEELRSFEIVDTPGLGAVKRSGSGPGNGSDVAEEQDSINTREFLREVNPDAVVYLFRRGVSGSDAELAETFQGAALGLSRPLNTIGVYSRFDDIPLAENPVDSARRIAQRWESDPKVSGSIYRVFPVCARMALGARTMDEKEFDWLRTLAQGDEKRIRFYCERGMGRFVGNQELLLDAGTRQLLCDRFTLLGVFLACEWLRTNPEGTRAALVRELEEKSGFADFLEALKRHFGGRSAMLKLNRVFRTLRDFCYRNQNTADIPLRECLYWFDRQLQNYDRRLDEIQAFDELLRAASEKRLSFSDGELQELVHLSGAKGRACAIRLGLSQVTPFEQLLAHAEKKHTEWNGKAVMAASRNLRYREAARAMRNGYNSLRRDIGDAMRLLDGE